MGDTVVQSDNYFSLFMCILRAHFGGLYLRAQWEYDVVLWICLSTRWGKLKKVVVIITDHPTPS